MRKEKLQKSQSSSEIRPPPSPTLRLPAAVSSADLKEEDEDAHNKENGGFLQRGGVIRRSFGLRGSKRNKEKRMSSVFWAPLLWYTVGLCRLKALTCRTIRMCRRPILALFNADWYYALPRSFQWLCWTLLRGEQYYECGYLCTENVVFTAQQQNLWLKTQRGLFGSDVLNVWFGKCMEVSTTL